MVLAIPPSSWFLQEDVSVRARWYIFVVIAAVAVLLSHYILTLRKEGDEPSLTPSIPEYVHYGNEEFGFSFDYPEDWLLEKVNPDGMGIETGIGIKPADSEHNEIQIAVYDGYPMIGSFGESFFAQSQRDSLEQFFGQLGAGDLNILVNERVKGMWDWQVSFTVTLDDTPIQGGVFTKEKYINDDECTVYGLFYLHSDDWPEGLKVIDSFTISD